MRRHLACAIAGAMYLYSGISNAAQVGVASYYNSGRITANGEAFNPYGMTAAHKTLKFGTIVKVVDLDTGNFVVVRINDRGPFIRGRIIDLSLGAAELIGIRHSGLAKVKVIALN